jgi:hypothetical protein
MPNRSSRDRYPTTPNNGKKAAVKVGEHFAENLAALAQKLSPEVSVHPSVDPIAALIGTLHLGTTDLAKNHDRYLTADLERELNPGKYSVHRYLRLGKPIHPHRNLPPASR